MPETDVIIIGAGIGGLSTGALLAKHGLKVLILEQAPHPGGLAGYFNRNGYLFQATAQFYSGFDLGGGHEQVLSQLGLATKKHRLEPGLQIVLPNHRLSLMPEKADILTELGREFPDSIAGIKGFCEPLERLEEAFFQLQRHKTFFSPDGLMEKYRFNQEIHSPLNRLYPRYQETPFNELERLVGNPEFTALLNTLSFHYAQLPVKECSAIYCAHLLGIPRRGLYYLKGGGQQLIDTLANYVLQQRGKIACQKRVDKILLDGKRVRGVRLASGEEHLAQYVVANAALENIQRQLLPDSSREKWLAERLEEINPQWSVFSVYLGVTEDVLPTEIRENVLLLTDYKKPLGGTNNLSITVNPPDDPVRAPKGKRAMTISCFLPKGDWQRNGDYTERKRQQTEEIIDAASNLITFLREGIDYQDSATPLTYQDFTARPQGLATNLAATESGFGFKGFSNLTPYKNFFLVGDTCLPGSGTNMVSISALNLVRCICG